MTLVQTTRMPYCTWIAKTVTLAVFLTQTLECACREIFSVTRLLMNVERS